MDYRVNHEGERKFIEVIPGSDGVEDAQDALELVVICHENDTNLVMLYEDNLSPDFFHLKSGVAGDILQKLVNYHIKTALVMDTDRIGEGRFKEMMLEARSHNSDGRKIGDTCNSPWRGISHAARE